MEEGDSETLLLNKTNSTITEFIYHINKTLNDIYKNQKSYIADLKNDYLKNIKKDNLDLDRFYIVTNKYKRDVRRYIKSTKILTSYLNDMLTLLSEMRTKSKNTLDKNKFKTNSNILDIQQLIQCRRYLLSKFDALNKLINNYNKYVTDMLNKTAVNDPFKDLLNTNELDDILSTMKKELIENIETIKTQDEITNDVLLKFDKQDTNEHDNSNYRHKTNDYDNSDYRYKNLENVYDKYTTSESGTAKDDNSLEIKIEGKTRRFECVEEIKFHPKNNEFTTDDEMDGGKSYRDSRVNKLIYYIWYLKYSGIVKLTVMNVTSDGNCYFRSISYILFGDESYYGFVKEIAVEIFNKFNHERLKEIVPGVFLDENSKTRYDESVIILNEKNSWADNEIITVLEWFLDLATVKILVTEKTITDKNGKIQNQSTYTISEPHYLTFNRIAIYINKNNKHFFVVENMYVSCVEKNRQPLTDKKIEENIIQIHDVKNKTIENVIAPRINEEEIHDEKKRLYDIKITKAVDDVKKFKDYIITKIDNKSKRILDNKSGD